MARVMFTTAPLDVGYSRSGVPPRSPATEAMLTIAPPSPAAMAGTANLAISIMLVTLIRRPCVHSARSTSTAVPLAPLTPTLLTRMSRRPNADCACCTTAAHCTGSVTSASRTIASPPSASIMSRVRSAQPRLASTSTTRVPASASRREAAPAVPDPVCARPGPSHDGDLAVQVLGDPRLLVLTHATMSPFNEPLRP